MRKYATSIICLLSALPFAGCGHFKNILSEEILDKSGTEWTDSKDKSANILVLGPAMLSGNNLVVPVKCYQVKVEVAFDEYYWKHYSLGAPLYSGHHRKNVRLTGEQRKEESPCSLTEGQASVTGVLPSGRAISPALTEQASLRNGSFTFPIKQLAESLSKKPESLAITVAPVNQPDNVVKAVLDAGQVTALNLQSENWLSAEALTTLLMTRISAALKTNDYRAALPWFRRLEERGKGLPEGFYYSHIAALSDAGEYPAARIRMNAYVKKYGKRGKYYPQVVELMSKQPSASARPRSVAATPQPARPMNGSRSG
jgi:hypothetical protein